MTAAVAQRSRRILAILECSPRDDAVLERAVSVALENDAHLTIVAVALRPLPFRASTVCGRPS